MYKKKQLIAQIIEKTADLTNRMHIKAIGKTPQGTNATQEEVKE